MEIKSITCIGDKVYFHFVCESCKKDVGDGDKYCRNCGRKLEPMATVASIKVVSSILTKALKVPAEPSSNDGEPEMFVGDITIGEGGSAGDDAACISSKTPSDSKVTMTEQNQPRCPRCKSKKEGCEFLSEDGECHGVVFPTFPPQFGECVY